ncbi:DNA/RNA non-specific endonuclease [Kribbella sp. CA-293567]|uniref:DNA/RNA non-specific endonuclease n=1 Tax=Kribbella sp. CA-293567 TaxID=3002436 RepID=UPI0022DDCEFE|nr:DNA/RNA non-specific endonuclease [Kribbella sp. CA-293567]WBQ08443.1 DNA/RNA non-specific endonuclease [Kribbella sp. CA-293567]
MARLREDFKEGRGDQGRTERQAVTRRDGTPGVDNGGHYLAKRFFDDDSAGNLFAQNQDFNNNAYREVENEWAAWVDAGYEVAVVITPRPGNARPDELTVSYTVVDTRTAQEQVVWSGGRTFVNAGQQRFLGFVAAQALNAVESVGTTKVGANQFTRTVGQSGAVDTVVTVIRDAAPRVNQLAAAVGPVMARRYGVPADAEGNVLGHRPLGPGGTAQLLPPGTVLDAATYGRLEQQWLAEIAAGNEVVITARRVLVPGQELDSVELEVSSAPRSTPATTDAGKIGTFAPGTDNLFEPPTDPPTGPRVERFVPGWVLVSFQSSKLLESFGEQLGRADGPGGAEAPMLPADLASIAHEGNGVYKIRTWSGEIFRLVKRVGPLQPEILLEYSVQLDGTPVVELTLSDRLTQDEIAPMLARLLAESVAIIRGGEVDGPQVFRPDGSPEVDAVRTPADLADQAELRQRGSVQGQLSATNHDRRAMVKAEIQKLALAMGVVSGQPNAELLRSLLSQQERDVLDRAEVRAESLDDIQVSRGGYLVKAALSSGWSSVVIGAAAAVFTGNPLVGLGIAIPTMVNAFVGSLSERYLDALKQPGKKPAYVAERDQREFDYPGIHGLLDGPEPVRPALVKMPRATNWSNYLVRYTTPTLATTAVAGALTVFGVPALSTAMVIASSALAKSLAERLVDTKKLEFRLRRVDATERIRLSDPALFSNQLVTELAELRTRLERTMALLDVRSSELTAAAQAVAQPPTGVAPVNPTVPGAPPFKVTLAVQLIDNVSAAARRVFVGGEQAVDVDPTELARLVNAQLEGLLNAVGPGLFGSVAGAIGDKYLINRDEAATDARKRWARTEQEARQTAALAEAIEPRLRQLRELAAQLEALTGAQPDLAARAADRGLPVPAAAPAGPRPSGQAPWKAYVIQVAAAALGGAVSAAALDLVFDLPDLGVVLTVAGAAGAMLGTPIARYTFRRTEIELQAGLEPFMGWQAVKRDVLLQEQIMVRYLAEQLLARGRQVDDRAGQQTSAEAPVATDPRYTDHVRAALRRAELGNVPPGRPESDYNLDARAERVEALQRVDRLAANVDRLAALGVRGELLTEARAKLRFAIGLYESIADSNGVRKTFPDLGAVDPLVGRRVTGLTDQARLGVEQALRRLVAEPAGKPLLVERLVALEQLAQAARAVDHHAVHGTDESRALVQSQLEQVLDEAARLWQAAGVRGGLVLPALSVLPGLDQVGGQVTVPVLTVPPVGPDKGAGGGRHHRPESFGEGVLEWNHRAVNGARSLFPADATVDRVGLSTVERGLAALVERGYRVEVAIERVPRPGPATEPYRFTVLVTDTELTGSHATEVYGPSTASELVASLGFDSPPGRHHATESTGRHQLDEVGGRHRVENQVDRSRLENRADLPGGRHRAAEPSQLSAREAAEQTVTPALAQTGTAPTAVEEEAVQQAVSDSVASVLPGAIPLQGGGFRATSASGQDVVLGRAAMAEVQAEARRVLVESNDPQLARTAARQRLVELLAALGVGPRVAASAAPGEGNPLNLAAVRRTAEQIARQAARLAETPESPIASDDGPTSAAPETPEATGQSGPNTAPPASPSTAPPRPGPDGHGPTVHAPEIPGTRFTANGRVASTHPASPDEAVREAVQAARAAVEADFGGLITGQIDQVSDGIIVVQTDRHGAQHFKVSFGPVSPRRVAATKVRAGTVEDPHLVRLAPGLASDQFTRAWVHEISHTLQELAAPRSRLRQLLRRPSTHTEDACVAAQFNEFRLLAGQWAAADAAVRAGRTGAAQSAQALANDLELLATAIEARGQQPPILPWDAPPTQSPLQDPVEGFVSDVADHLRELRRQADELRKRVDSKRNKAIEAAESARQSEQIAADALAMADSGRFARARQAMKDAAKQAEVQVWHEQVAAGYQSALGQLEKVAQGYEALLTDARSITPRQRATIASGLVTELTAYEQRLAAVAPSLIALSSLLPTGWLPHLSALTNRVNAVLAANGVDHRFTSGALQHRLNAEFGQLITADGASLRVGHARPIELRLRLTVSELVEILDPSIRASETMLGLLPQPSRKHEITQNGRIGAGGSFALNSLTRLFGEGSWLNAVGELLTVRGEQVSGRGRSVSSTGAQYGQDGAVEDNRGESLLYAAHASWQLQARKPGEPDQLLADLQVDSGRGKDVSRLYAWASHAYTVPAPTQTFTNGTPPSGRLPNHTLTSLDGLQRLTDKAFLRFRDQLAKFGDEASLLREQIHSAINHDLPSRLPESTERSILRPLQANGRPVGHVQIKTVARYELTELVGQPSTAHWQERVRVGFSNAGGQQNFSASTSFNATVGYGGQALTDLGDSSVDLGPSASGGRSVSRSESLSAGGVGIHVGVQRYTGTTQGYRLVFDHEVTVVLNGVPQGSVTGETVGLARLQTNDAYRHGLPVAESAFVHDPGGNRVLEDGRPVLRGDPRAGVQVPGRRVELASWLTDVTGRVRTTGPGLAQRVTGGEQALADLVGPLAERGFLPPLDAQGDPNLGQLTADPLERHAQLLNLTELRTQLSVNRLEAGYDIAVQQGIVVTLTRPRTGLGTETISLRIGIRPGPVSAVRVTDDEAMVTLNIGSDSVGRSTGWSKSLPWNASPLGLSQDGSGGGIIRSGVSYGRQALGRTMGWFTGGTVNQVTLIESRSAVAAFEVPHRIEVTELGVQDVVLHNGAPGTSARILVDTDLLPSADPARGQVSAGPLSDQVLDRTTLVALDTHELPRLVDESITREPAARHHLAALLDPRHLLAHPEWARTSYRSDAVVRGAGPVSTRSGLSISGKIVDVVLLGTTDAVVGDINLALSSHGLSVGQSTGASAALTLGATAESRSGTASAEYGNSSSTSRTGQTITGVERLTIEVGRHYLFAGTAELAVTTTADGKPLKVPSTVVFQVAERDVLQFHVDGELSLPLTQVADAVERYLNGSLELNSRLALGLIRQYRATLAGARAANEPVPALSVFHTPRAVLAKLQRGRPTPGTKEARLDSLLQQAEQSDRTRTIQLPEHYRNNFGSSLIEQAMVTENGQETTMFGRVLEVMTEQLGAAPDSDPMLARALFADLAGKRWWGRFEDMRGPKGFQRTYAIGKPGQFGAQRVTLTIQAEFTGPATSLGVVRNVISIVQRYLYDDRSNSSTTGQSLGAGLSGGLEEGRTGSASTDRTDSTTVSIGEQTTRLERIASFDGLHRVRRGVTYTLEVTPEPTAIPPRTRIGQAMTRSESPLVPVRPVRLTGEIVQLIPARMLPELPLDGPSAPPEHSSARPATAVDPRGLPDAFFVEGAEGNELPVAIARRLAEPDLLGRAGIEAHRSALQEILATAAMNASFSRMARDDGFDVLELSLPGYASGSVKVRVAANVVGARLISGPVDAVEIGEVNRSQHTVTHTVNSGRLAPVDGGATAADADSGLGGGLTAGDQLADRTTDGRGVRRERSRFEQGSVVTVQVEVEYDVKLIREIVRRSGELRPTEVLRLEQAPRGTAYLTMFEADYLQLLAADGNPAPATVVPAVRPPVDPWDRLLTANLATAPEDDDEECDDDEKPACLG